MNIGIFTDTFTPQINGVVTSINMLEHELTKMGHRVFIFTASDPNEKHKSPRVFRLPSFPFIFLPSCRMAFFYPPKLLLSLGKIKLDVIHTQTEFPLGIFGMLVSEFYRLPHVHTYHTMYEDYVHYIANGHLFTPKMARQYSRIFCNGAGVVIAPVEKAKASLLDYGVKRPIRVIPTGFDFSHFDNVNCDPEEIINTRAEFGIAADMPVIVTVCRIAKEKSIDVIINQMPKLLEKLPDLKFVIVGDGPYKSVLTELCDKLNVSSSVIFAGSRPWVDIAKYYRLGDLFVSASTSETQGLTYIEAMASRVAVAARRDPSIEGVVINGKTGYTFENEADCAETLYTALTSDNSVMKETAWLNIQNMSAVNFARAVEAVYTEALENKPRKWYKFKIPKIFTKAASFVFDLRKSEFKDSKFPDNRDKK